MEEKIIVDIETAKEDLERFINALRITSIKRKRLIEEEDYLIDLIQEGFLTIDEEGKLKYKLMYPLESDENTIELEYLEFKLRRVRVEDLEKRMNGKNDIEKTRRLMGFLCNQNAALLSKLHVDDLNSISNISAFFLPKS